jgi:hypothetical protein
MKASAHAILLPALLAALLLGPALPSPGQIEASSADWSKRFGPPTRVETNAAGLQTVSYRNGPFEITADGRDNVALRVVYRKKDLSAGDVQTLLDLNRGNAEWAVLTGSESGKENPPTAWIRSDDRALATRNEDEFTVTAAEWNRLPSGDSESPPPAPVVVSAAPPAPPPLPLPPPPRLKAPAVLPRPGDTRAKALDLLGPPQGNIVSGPKEIMQYPWGQIVLRQGVIVQIN